MEKSEFIIVIVLASIVLLLVGMFLLFAFIWYRKKRNAEIIEKDHLKILYEKQMLQTRLEIQEQAMNHISKEIHDNVGQELSLTKIQLNIIEVSEGISKEVLLGARESLGKAILVLRDMAHSMSADRIRHFDLIPALEEEISKITRTRLLQVTLTIDGEQKPISEEKKLLLFRVMQESLNNIIKHAHATVADIGFFYQETGLRIIIGDNGKGFDVSEARKKKTGLGLDNITTRPELAGGTCTISSSPDRGTTITIFMPYG